MQTVPDRSVVRKSFIAAWLGWAFDGLDGYLYVLVAVPFVKELLQRSGTYASDQELMADVALKAAIIQAFFLFGWAAGGAFFGRLGDRLGRARTLTLTILVYAIFTGLSVFAQEWWHLLILRFVAALGIGGEWAAGSALVCETMHPRHRAWASAALQSGYMVGMILAAGTIGLFQDIPSKRWVFLVGVLPALATIWVRRNVPEPPAWKTAAERERVPSVAELLRPGLRSTTLLTLATTTLALTTVWAFLYFGPQAIRAIPEAKDWPKPKVESLVMRLTILFTTVNIIANFAATYLARAIGYRRAMTAMFIGSLATYLIGYWRPLTLESAPLVLSVTAFFCLGLFGIFPLYIPTLFPTLVRTLGAGVCYNTGRVVAGVGVLFVGAITRSAGGPSAAIWWSGLLYIPAIVVALFLPERARDEPEPCPEGAGP